MGLHFFRNEDILVGGFEHFSVSILYIQDIILPIDKKYFKMVAPPSSMDYP
jgi:hypothetical protein